MVRDRLTKEELLEMERILARAAEIMERTCLYNRLCDNLSSRITELKMDIEEYSLEGRL